MLPPSIATNRPPATSSRPKISRNRPMIVRPTIRNGELADVLLEERQRALAGELGGLGVVGAALVAVEAVAGTAVEVPLHLGMLAEQLLRLRRRRALVELAEVAQGRHLRVLVHEVRHAAA